MTAATSSLSWPRVPMIPLLCNVLYGAALVVLAVVEEMPVPAVGLQVSDTVIHAIAYGGQAALLYWALRHAVDPVPALMLAWLGGCSLGIATEILQLQVAARTAETVDIVADTFGATVVVVGVLVARSVLGVTRGAMRRGDGRPA